MNLIFRMLFVFITSLFKPKIDNLTATTSLRLRVLPNDLDINGHMNNGRYFTIMDLGRFDLILRTGLLKMMMREKSVPVLGSAKIRYRLPLLPFQAFDLKTRIIAWDEKWVYIEQKFVIASGEKKNALAAIAVLKGSFYSNKTKTTVPTAELLHLINHDEPSPEMPDYLVKWIESEELLRGKSNRE
jgi:acyl-CoA thioesterase FadM